MVEGLAKNFPVEKVMPNGVRLFRIPGDGKGSVRLDILFDGGYGVQSKPLQAMFVNRMLREGCNGMSASEISCPAGMRSPSQK